MNSFLSELSRDIKNKYNSPKNLCVVLPSRRAGTFLKQELAKAYQCSFQAPTIITLDDFVEEICDVKRIDNLNCFFELYECYLSLFENNEHKNEKADTLEEFINWAPNLLADFNEIDKYLVNSISLFSYINDIRAIETWNINGEPLTKQQQSYLKLWKRIGSLYHQLKKKLIKDKKGYSGLIFRQCAENIGELTEKIKYEEVIFAGFNAFSESEKKIVSHLIKIKKATIYWDADEYYMNDENQEAGNFLRKIKKDWTFSEFKNTGNHYINSTKQINIYNCNTNFAQSILSAYLLKDKNANSELQTALVLNKEDLLLPVLNNLPDNVSAANITMGYELKHTPMASFVKILLDLWHSKDNKTNKNAFYYKNVLQSLEHSYFELLVDDKKSIVKLKQEIIKSNKVYVSSKFIKSFIDEDLCNLIFFAENQDLEDNTKKLLGILAKLKSIFNYESESSDSSSYLNLKQFDKSLHIEFIYHYTVVFRKLLNSISTYPALKNCSLKLFRKLISQLVNKEKISFLGEPLKGIQIMGMLETRALDFEHLILLSVNEGVLPSSKKNNSFIPFDVKLEFGLPTHREHDAIFANHFYRLLQRANTIDIVYHSGNDDFGAGTEKSRYIEQILHEFPKYNEDLVINQFEYNPIANLKTGVKTVEKNESFIDRLSNRLKKGLSPSALNTMINCSMDYYYKYILSLGEMEEMEENIHASTFGTCIHNTIEKLYKSHTEKVITKDFLKTNSAISHQVLKQEFLTHFSESDIQQGSNLLSLTVAKNYLDKFFEFENEQVKKGEYIINKVEDTLESSLKLDINGTTIEILVNGKIDCVFELNGELHLLDYKTGSVNQKEDLTVSSEEDFYSGSKTKGHKSKALQLLCYTWLYYNKYPETTNITPCIFSFKKSKEGLQQLTYNKSTISKTEVLEMFPKIVKIVLEEQYDKDTHLQHDVSSKYCQYCS